MIRHPLSNVSNGQMSRLLFELHVDEIDEGLEPVIDVLLGKAFQASHREALAREARRDCTVVHRAAQVQLVESPRLGQISDESTSETVPCACRISSSG